MRVAAWMIFSLLISILIMDITIVYTVRGKIIQSADMALDAALVGGLLESEIKTGRSFVDEDRGYSFAIKYFKENMNLDSNLENEFLKGTRFDLTFEQNGLKPKATVHIKTVIKAMSPKVIGLEGIPIVISKTQYHISNYK